MRPQLLAIGAALAFATSLTGAAGADDAEAWRYQCLGDEVVGTKICTTELAVFEEGEEFIVYFVHTEQGEPPLVVSGERDDLARTTIAVDKKDPVTSESCEDGVCVFSGPDSDRLMIMFRKGFRAQVTIWAEDRQAVFDRKLTLRGFSAALTAPPG